MRRKIEDSGDYTLDERRKQACIDACDGFPTVALEMGVVKQMFALTAFLALADHMGDVEGGFLKIPHDWWQENFREPFDRLNAAAAKAADAGDLAARLI